MDKRITVLGAVLAAMVLTACSSQVPVHVALAPIHATLDPAAVSQAGRTAPK